MAKTPIWRAIATQLCTDLSDGIYAAGDKLPSEAALSQKFGVNRHTVRQALAQMASDGLVNAKRGAGVFVIGTPTDYPIGKRVRFHQNLKAAGRMPAKTVLELTTRRATPEEVTALNLSDDALVHCYEGLSLADKTPIALFQSIFPADRFPNMLTNLEGGGSVSSALAAEGLHDYIRVSTRITAKLATATQAGHLRIAQGAPVLRSISINTDLDGIPIEVGRTWFAGDRVTLTVNDL